MRAGHPGWAHLEERDGRAALRRLPSGFRAGQAATDDCESCLVHQLCKTAAVDHEGRPLHFKTMKVDRYILSGVFGGVGVRFVVAVIVRRILAAHDLVALAPGLADQERAAGLACGADDR